MHWAMGILLKRRNGWSLVNYKFNFLLEVYERKKLLLVTSFANFLNENQSQQLEET